MNMLEKVNKKQKISLTPSEKAEAYNEIKKACSKNYLTEKKTIDNKKIKEVFAKYFGKENGSSMLDIDASIDNSSFNPLITTAWHGNEEEAKELLKLGANPRCSLVKGVTPIHIAATNGKFFIIKLLLDHEKKNTNDFSLVNISNEYGQTPLMLAAEAGHSDIIKYLVTIAKADPTIKDKNNKTALDYAEMNRKLNVSALLRYHSLNNEMSNNNHNNKKPSKI